MSSVKLSNLRWRKSSRSNGNGNECIEVAFVPGSTALRDSKNPHGGTLVLPPTGWTAFLSGVSAG